MDLNLVVLAGRIAADPEVRQFESGSRLIRYLVTVRSEVPRRRVDVIPVTRWNPDDGGPAEGLDRGTQILVVGAVQRRFWEADRGRRSRLELVAHHMEARPLDSTENDEVEG